MRYGPPAANTHASSGTYNAASELTGLTHQLTSGSTRGFIFVRPQRHSSAGCG
jgi:hypothetical protein